MCQWCLSPCSLRSVVISPGLLLSQTTGLDTIRTLGDQQGGFCHSVCVCVLISASVCEDRRKLRKCQMYVHFSVFGDTVVCRGNMSEYMCMLWKDCVHLFYKSEAMRRVGWPGWLPLPGAFNVLWITLTLLVCQRWLLWDHVKSVKRIEEQKWWNPSVPEIHLLLRPLFFFPAPPTVIYRVVTVDL